MTPQRRGRPPTRDTRKILKSAQNLFELHGYAETTIAQIAKAADASPPAIYARFQNKDGLYREVLEEVLEEIRNVIYEPEERPAARNVSAVLDNLIKACIRRPGFGKLIVADLVIHGGTPSLAALHAEAARRELRQDIQAIVKAGMARGPGTAEVEEALTFIVVSVMFAIMASSPTRLASENLKPLGIHIRRMLARPW